MKIALYSDLHLEFGQRMPAINPNATLVVLAGDIDRHANSIDIARGIHAQHHVPVIVLAGNHEHYRADLESNLAKLRTSANALDGIYFLECDTVVIDNVRFLGCTLWTNFEINGPQNASRHMRIASQGINDFRLIRYRGDTFTPWDAKAIFQKSYAWLEKQLAKPFDGKTVVITHFAPHFKAIHSNFLQNGIADLTPSFTIDCSPLMSRYRINAWLFGHTHNSIDEIVEGGTRLVSNQRGYPSEPVSYTQFDPNKLITL